VFSLVPVLVSFYVGSPEGRKGPPWNQAMLFVGMAVSRSVVFSFSILVLHSCRCDPSFRIGLWGFDLCQLKVLQTGLADHPRRNALSGLQYSLQNMFDLAKYVLTIILR